jgi:trans-2,3-dihydro-3-hydroxyanthranilate isomerase
MTNCKQFVIADVFSEKRFGGNQLAVFTDASGLDDATMQNIAREMNYSETTFLLPPESGGDYHVRIFTPAHELPFAGHPVVGSGYVIVAEGLKQLSNPITTVALETGVGVLNVEVQSAEGTLGRSTMTQPIPVVRGTFEDTARVAKALSLDGAQLDKDYPVQTVFNGIAVIVVPVKTLSAVQNIKVDVAGLEEISNEVGATTVLAFTSETLSPDSTVHCRVFAPAAGVIEDAATGSANGSLGFYLVHHKIVQANPTARIVSEQGFEMNRPSMLYLDVDVDSESDKVSGVRVGGGVVITGRGEIYVD